ncbi:MAG: hypothetical protein LC101_01880, partial [Flavobacteriales bacterium]|nr:hypothetical protein [Flavobacteriales bacterium]
MYRHTYSTYGVCNTVNGQSTGMHYQWQVNSSTANPTPTTNLPSSGWIDIAGANSPTYTPPQTSGSRLYRCLITSNCTPDFSIASFVATSECVRVTYHPYSPPIQSAICNSAAVANTPYMFSALLPPGANASVNESGFVWSVTPSAGVIISNPNSSSTSITFPGNGAYTITLTTQDACAVADATSTCTVAIADNACDIIYVAPGPVGNDANLGYINAPVATLYRALQLVTGSRTIIRMQAGAYNELNIANMKANVVVDGGYSSTWVKSSAIGQTVINFANTCLENINSDIQHLVGIKADNVNNWVLQDLTINVAASTGITPSGNGRSNYGLLIRNSTGYSVVRCSINSGNATSGANGQSGAAGTNGIAGGSGQRGNSTMPFLCGNDSPGAGGGAGTAGVGGANAPSIGGNAGNGGNGGNGGIGGDDDGGDSSCDNTPSQPGAPGIASPAPCSTPNGAAGARGSCDNNNSETPYGGTGGSGIHGGTGASGTTVGPSYSSGYYLPSYGTNGLSGCGGGGGGGGGGADKDYDGCD